MGIQIVKGKKEMNGEERSLGFLLMAGCEDDLSGPIAPHDPIFFFSLAGIK